jgi:hypothetical protein
MPASLRVVVGCLDHLCPSWLRTGSHATRAAKRRKWSCAACGHPLMWLYLEGESSVDIKCPDCGKHNLLPPPE